MLWKQKHFVSSHLRVVWVFKHTEILYSPHLLAASMSVSPERKSRRGALMTHVHSHWLYSPTVQVVEEWRRVHLIHVNHINYTRGDAAPHTSKDVWIFNMWCMQEINVLLETSGPLYLHIYEFCVQKEFVELVWGLKELNSTEASPVQLYGTSCVYRCRQNTDSQRTVLTETRGRMVDIATAIAIKKLLKGPQIEHVWRYECESPSGRTRRE